MNDFEIINNIEDNIEDKEKLKSWKCSIKDEIKFIEENIEKVFELLKLKETNKYEYDKKINEIEKSGMPSLSNYVISYSYHYLGSKNDLKNPFELGRLLKNLIINKLNNLGFKNAEKSINIQYSMFSMKALIILIDVLILLEKQ